MPQLAVEDIEELMAKPDYVRNISIIAHVDHGKSTVTDSLVCKGGIIPVHKAGDMRYTDTRKDEQDRCITIKATAISLVFDVGLDGDENKEKYLINLIDSPGHVDFSSEVTAALRVTDGAVVVVECNSGVCVQTETVLNQALMERVKPILFLNKLDLVFITLNMEGEEIYNSFLRIIESVNALISQGCGDVDQGDELQLQITTGDVGFGSALQGWGFTIPIIADYYSKKFGISKAKMLERLWGDNFRMPNGKWTKNENEGVRGIICLVFEPIRQLLKACNNQGNTADALKMADKLGIKISADDANLSGKQLIKKILGKWLPLGETIIQMVAKHLPSPVTAQKYRVEQLYTGNLDDPCAAGIRNCDPNGPLVLFISKMVPYDKGRFLCMGRVYSGTAYANQKVKIITNNDNPDSHKINKVISRVVLMSARQNPEQLAGAPAGNIIGIVGIDKHIMKTATLSDDAECCPIRQMKFSVSPVVRVAVAPKNTADLPKLIDGLIKLKKSDPMVECISSESGEHVIAGAGELHLEICLKDLEEDHACIPIIKSDPVVSYRETCRKKSQVRLTKSPNQHNRLYVYSQAMTDDLVEEMESGRLIFSSDMKERAKNLEKFGIDPSISRRCWSFGEDPQIANLLCDSTKGAQFISEIKDSCIAGFCWALKDGPLCKEAMRGVHSNLVDVTLHADSIHRGANQIVDPMRRVILGTFLEASPTLVEPVYVVEVQSPYDSMGGVMSTLNKRGGAIISQDEAPMPGQQILTAHLAVNRSFGFTSDLRSNTQGKAFPQMRFDHWRMIMDDPYIPGSQTNQIVLEIRKRKGLKEMIPKPNEFLDIL